MKNQLVVAICILSTLLSAQERPPIDTLIIQDKAIVSDDPDASLAITYQAYEQSITEDYYWGKTHAAKWIAEAHHYKGQMDSMDKYNHINSDDRVVDGIQIRYRASESVSLESGFTVHEAGTLEVSIELCED